jgi:hypothetical protein
MKRKVDESDDEELPLLPITKKYTTSTADQTLTLEVDATLLNNNTGLDFIDSDEDELPATFFNRDDLPTSSNPKQKLLDHRSTLNDLEMDDLFAPAQTSIKSNIFTSDLIPMLKSTSIPALTIPTPASRPNVNTNTIPSPKLDYTKQPLGQYVSAMSSFGVQLYFPRKNITKLVNPGIQNQGRLLSGRISVLMDQAKDHLAVQKALELSAIEEKNRQQDFFDPLQPLIAPKRELWVDKYSPKEYTDLVGDEVISLNLFFSKLIDQF